MGLGSRVHGDSGPDARPAAALIGIQTIEGVEVGEVGEVGEVDDGFDLARVPGSKARDEILATDEASGAASRRSGGTEGGLSTGEPLRVRAAMKQIATAPGSRTIDSPAGKGAAVLPIGAPRGPSPWSPTSGPADRRRSHRRGQATQPHHQRSDACAVPAAGVLDEALAVLVLAGAVVERFGGDSVPETRRNMESYPDNPAIR
ncbi:chorismate synthase [Streptomyces turgidiscabies]|uniref:chorismate synthase n=1 Tax=Streptomyces turgidiscabies TaxID=85558 RepID=A0ABU0RH15_9ACTN|nr:chorismate synthase [Streptomyces turgidiscabies]